MSEKEAFPTENDSHPAFRMVGIHANDFDPEQRKKDIEKSRRILEELKAYREKKIN